MWYTLNCCIFEYKKKINPKNKIMSNEQKFTEIGKSYWNGTGLYNKEYNELYKEMVPASGESDTLNGELIRAISRLGYEYDNNGNCNSREIGTYTEEECCSECDGSGTVEGEYDEETDTCETEDCDVCYGDGYFEEEYNEDPEINEFYNSFLKLIEENVFGSSDECDNVRGIITRIDDCDFSDVEQNKYDRLFDKVMFYVLNNEDKNLPEWYLNQ